MTSDCMDCAEDVAWNSFPWQKNNSDLEKDGSGIISSPSTTNFPFSRFLEASLSEGYLYSNPQLVVWFS